MPPPACPTGYTDTYSWDGTAWSGACTQPPQPSCPVGYNGSYTWDTGSGAWVDGCTQPAEPTCPDGGNGNYTWDSTTGAWVGSCQQVCVIGGSQGVNAGEFPLWNDFSSFAIADCGLVSVIANNAARLGFENVNSGITDGITWVTIYLPDSESGVHATNPIQSGPNCVNGYTICDGDIFADATSMSGNVPTAFNGSAFAGATTNEVIGITVHEPCTVRPAVCSGHESCGTSTVTETLTITGAGITDPNGGLVTCPYK